MVTRAANIIGELYGKELRPPRRGFLRFFRKHRFLKQREDVIPLLNSHVAVRLITPFRLILGIVTLFAVVHCIIGLYFFNQFSTSEQAVLKEESKIQSLLQKRRNLSVNLLKMVRDFGIHESGLFKEVVDVRVNKDTPYESATGASKDLLSELSAFNAEDEDMKGDILRTFLAGTGKMGVAGGQGITGLFALSEQYPELKLSENFKVMMDALVDTERELSNTRKSYSKISNNYSTSLKTFPGNILGWAYGFKPVEYFKAEARAGQFVPVEY